MSTVYDLSWNETSFLAKLQLFFKSNKQERRKIQSRDLQVQAEGYSALSSTYYSIVGTAYAQLKVVSQPKLTILLHVVAYCFTWLPLAVWCYWRMLTLSNHVVTLIGYEGMNADQCDVRQSILRRRGQYDEAKKCIHATFIKHVEKAHTRGLLHVGLAEIYRHECAWRKAQVEVLSALTEAEKTESQDPRQAMRIYRSCADLTDYFGNFMYQGNMTSGDKLRSKAQALAEETGAQDQLLKL